MHFNIYYVFLFKMFSPTCFGWHSGHLQGDIITTVQKVQNVFKC